MASQPTTLLKGKQVSVFPWPSCIFWMSTWYLSSGVTLFANRVILKNGCSPPVLAMIQIVSSAFFGAIKLASDGSSLNHPTAAKVASAASSEGRDGDDAPTRRGTLSKHAKGLRSGPARCKGLPVAKLMVVAVLRVATLVLGLLALDSIAVSFVEAIKSTAPLFTVCFAWLILQERTSMRIMASLVPVVLGLALASGTEESMVGRTGFLGFSAALLNNCLDCVSNVVSKKLMAEDLSPSELQFWSGLLAVIMQLPLSLLVSGSQGFPTPPQQLWGVIGVDATAFYVQSLSAYMTMSIVGPVTMSVANTVKRGLLIALSVWYFHNLVTTLNALGMALILVGVTAYSRARQREAPRVAPVLANEKGVGDPG